MRRSIAAVVAGAASIAAAQGFADTIDGTEGTVLAFDRVAHILVMNDKTVYSLPKDLKDLPETLSAGDDVKLKWKSQGDDGVAAVISITMVTDKP